MSRFMALFDLERLGSRDRRALLWGLALVVPMFVWVAGVRPYRSALSGLEDRIATEEALLARERGLMASEATLREAFDGIRGEARTAERGLVLAANAALAEAELTDYIEVAAVESRVLLREIRSVAPPAGQEVPEGLEGLRLSLRGESDLEGVLGFLRAVETSPLLLRIGGLSVEPVAGGEDVPSGGVLDFTVVLEGFTRPVGSRLQEETDP